MDDGQKTPRGHPDSNSYVKIQPVFMDNGQTNRRTDKQTEKLIRCRLGNHTRCTWAGGTFFHCLRKVSPAHQRSTGVWYKVQEFGW
jgi:hypothetical protein